MIDRTDMKECEGDGAVLVVVDRGEEKGYAPVGEAVFAAFGHLGIPFRT